MAITLAELLKAKRPDMLDGFPLRAALKALSLEGSSKFKQAYLNDLLESENVEVLIARPAYHLMPGFKEAGIVGALTYSDGSIEVKVQRSFFNNDKSAMERAMRFQSIVAHELVHRHQFASKTLHSAAFRSDDELCSIEYLNDPFELEAMAAEVAHDSIIAGMSAFEGAYAQPRLADLTANAKHLRPEAIKAFQQAVASFK